MALADPGRAAARSAAQPALAGRAPVRSAASPSATRPSAPRLRCAIYTRKSSEEGLEQAFNSLHAQREACEAFVTSQRHEGWSVVATAYDDGGLSGGSMDRPALERLLADIGSGLIDAVVVYKVDRLTRSLADFARLTELFEAHGIAFVSVTQAFNTSTSMGRLTLNVLLSFAQFEREVAGERIRDKIALSKRKGMWMGGLAPLGYDGRDRTLVVNQAEAATVNLIYARYLALGSVPALKRELDAAGIVSKRRTFADGRTAGGVPISRGALYTILTNAIYRGQIAHRGAIHQGTHAAIVEEDLWSAVQQRIGRHPRSRHGHRSSGSLLAGLAFDASGHRLTPSHARKGMRVYRYYLSAPLTRGERTGIRLPADDLERAVIHTLADHLADGLWVARMIQGGMPIEHTRAITEAAAGIAMRLRHLADEHRASDADAGASAANAGDADGGEYAALLRSLIERVGVDDKTLAITLSPSGLADAVGHQDDGIDADAPALRIEMPHTLRRRGRQMRLVLGSVTARTRTPDADLVRLVRDGHRWFADLASGKASSIASLAARERVDTAHISRSLSLAFLAPDLVTMILGGTQPDALTSERLKAARPIPPSWAEQRRILIGEG